MRTIILDFETRSEADLRKVGAWAYSEDPTTQVIVACWTEYSWPVSQFTSWIEPNLALPYSYRRLGWGPEDLYAAALDEDVLFEAHNAAFEYSVWENVLHRRLGWPRVPLHRWRDTMAIACYYSLPAALDKLCGVLGLPGKDLDGARLIQKYSKLHLKTAKRDIPPEDVRKWIAYCGRDVLQERAVGEMLGQLPEPEEAIFLHDFEVAARGLRIDRQGVIGARRVVEQRSSELEEEFRALTGVNPSQRDKALGWFRERGLELEDLARETLEEKLEEVNLPRGEVRRALEVRLAHAKASTKKLDAMLRQCGKDGRARFQTRYHGAVTGRNTGSGFQPLNLVRGYENVPPEQLVRDIRTGEPKWLDALYGDAMDAVAKASRHWITASDGCRIIAGDFTSIEAVVNACLAGEEWKVEAFRRGDPIYELMGCKIHQLPAEAEALARADKKTFKARYGDERQDGKTAELAFGYQGALGAWRKFDKSERHTDEAVIEICRGWRRENAMIVQSWRELERTCVEAVRHPGRETGHREIGFERVDGWLTMILPNGKRLWYWAPQLRLVMPRWHEPDVREDCATGECNCEPVPQVHYTAQKTGRWGLANTYGGKLCENAVQATSREILKPVEIALERAGYPVVLSVYDEIICDVPNARGSVGEFSEIVAETVAGLPWARGWPITMPKPWEGGRYKK